MVSSSSKFPIPGFALPGLGFLGSCPECSLGLGRPLLYALLHPSFKKFPDGHIGPDPGTDGGKDMQKFIFLAEGTAGTGVKASGISLCFRLPRSLV